MLACAVFTAMVVDEDKLLGERGESWRSRAKKCLRLDVLIWKQDFAYNDIITFFLYDFFPADVAFARLLGWL